MEKFLVTMCPAAVKGVPSNTALDCFKDLSLLQVIYLSALYMNLFLEGDCKVLYKCWRDNGAMQLFTHPGSLRLASQMPSKLKFTVHMQTVSCMSSLDPTPWSTWHLLHLSTAWHSLHLNTLHCTDSLQSVCKKSHSMNGARKQSPSLHPPSDFAQMQLQFYPTNC